MNGHPLMTRLVGQDTAPAESAAAEGPIGSMPEFGIWQRGSADLLGAGLLGAGLLGAGLLGADLLGADLTGLHWQGSWQEPTHHKAHQSILSSLSADPRRWTMPSAWSP